MAGRHRTVHRRFDVADEFELPAALAVGGPDAMDLSDLVLVTTDWDTPDGRLAAWGHRLRHRQSSDGSERRWILSIRSGAASNGSGPPIIEVVREGPPTAPPSGLTQLVIGTTRGEELVPVVVVTTHRSRRILRRGRVELADEQISVRTPDDAAPQWLRQIQLQPIQQHAERDLRRVGRVLLDGGAEPAARSEPGRPTTISRPAIELRADSDVGTIARAAVVRGVHRLRTNEPLARLDDQIEAIHQCRVATRGLRSDLASLGPVLDAAWAGQLRQELRWIAEPIGAVRDLDVLAARIDARRQQLGSSDELAVSALVDAVRRQRRRRHQELLTELDSERYLRLLEDLANAERSVPLDPEVSATALGEPLLRRMTATAWKRAVRTAHHLGDEPDPADLHALRKRVKRTRAAAQLATPVIGAEARRFAKRLATLQDVLGDLNDSVVTRRWLEAEAPELDPGPVAFVAGRIAERETRHAERLQAEWRAVWDELRTPHLTRWLE